MIKLVNCCWSFVFAVICVSLIISECPLVFAGPVRVKMYDHRAEHDPKHLYGTGPWNYYGYGYGIEYAYKPDGTFNREKGYGYLKAFGRDFCKYKDLSKCRKSHPKKTEKIINRGEPFWGQPPAEIIKESEPNIGNGEKLLLPIKRSKVGRGIDRFPYPFNHYH
ncbi:uncharacterized protein LOC128395087 [Panonychus citri]|uniref:uncharacterized protein LOC128395087 n=1 Tax=Panonychus citri TaxID=50023 RepID=UPI0023072E6A|nr:uncharacterized protein LOC128395087 [Panonychus citri]